MAKYRSESIQGVATIARALGDEGRVRVLLALGDRELCVCQVIGLLGLAPSTVSRHLAVLRSAGMVTARRDGRWAWYRREPDPEPAVGLALQWLDACAAADETRDADRARLEELLAMTPQQLCRELGIC